MTQYTTIIDEVFVSCSVELDDDNKLIVEVEDFHPGDVYTEVELKNLVTKELNELREKNKLEFLLNQLEG